MIGCLALAMPSAVSIMAPSHSQARVKQERTGLPFMITVQEPQAPCPPHQSLGEFSPISSLRSCRKLQCGSTVYLYFPPLTVNSIVLVSVDACVRGASAISPALACCCGPVSAAKAIEPIVEPPMARPASFRNSLRDKCPDPSLPSSSGDFFSFSDILPPCRYAEFSPPVSSRYSGIHLRHRER